MVFSSPIFLFLFLPIVLAGYFVTRGRLRNLWLLGMSLVFYGWGARIELPVKELKNYTAWKDRMLQRPAVRKILEREQNILLKAA